MRNKQMQLEKQINQTILMVERLLRMKSVPTAELLVFASWLERLGQQESMEFFARQATRLEQELPSGEKTIGHEVVKLQLRPVIDYLSAYGRKKMVRKELIVSITKRFLDNVQWKKALENERYMTRFFGSVEDMLEVGYDLPTDALLIDYELVRASKKVQLDKLIKKLEATFTPLIIIGEEDQQTRQYCYQLGADDYWDETVTLIERQIRLKRLLHKLRIVSSTILVDELTGAFNRKYLQNAFQRRVSRLARDGQLFALAIFDLDHFKRINDLHGHPTGDLVLSELASLTKQAIRQEDEMIRFGGEEFMLLFSTEHVEAACVTMGKVRERIERHTFPNGLKVTVSIGVTLVSQPSFDLEEMTSEADEALYQAKRKGRNRVVAYSVATEKEKIEGLIKIDGMPLQNLSQLEVPEHPKYHFRVLPYEDSAGAVMQLNFVPLSMIAEADFRLLDQWKHEREHTIETIVTVTEESTLLGEALQRGVVDYCLLPLESNQIEEQIRQWVLRLS
ncbi:diguanylate cyclase [Exiguobacterium oxidotolerans]|uniref:GGDEF domain-containing protein n=1 Tax=Exiguobacterium oxidotolerans TaxID=223958 RepID=A0A653I798_9BACL|nr:diguanylate cyclase [Exiguobacterium oxidotolerans]VWX34674.1 conserved hypothetical protein [Exiguobacterium oxidotolerans]